jgi:hypothetical protein
MDENRRVREGMTVYGANGEKLGRVLSCDATGFVVEKGLIFKKDYVVHDEDVADVRGDEVRLSRAKSELAPSENLPGTAGTTGVPPPVTGFEASPIASGAAATEILRENARTGPAGGEPSQPPVQEPPAPYHQPMVAAGGLSPRGGADPDRGSTPREGTPPDPGSEGESGAAPGAKIGTERHDYENESRNAPREDPDAPGSRDPRR